MKLLLHNTGRSRYLVNMNPKHKRASLWTLASGLWANSGLAEVIWKTLLVWAQFSLPALPSTSAVTYNTFPILLQGYFSQACQWSRIVPLCGGFAMWKSVQEGPLSKWEWLSLQGQFSHYLFIILFYFFLRQLIQGAIIVVIFLWISIDCAMEGPVLTSHQTPLHSNAFQALLNWDRFDPRDENLNCNVSPWISLHQRQDNEAQCLWDDLEDKSTPITNFKSQQLDYTQPSRLVLEQVRWVPTSSSII